LNPPPIRKPPGIRKGDVVGVVAPAGALTEERLKVGLATIEAWGLVPRLGASVLARDAYLAGADGLRHADLQSVLDDAEVRAVFCARGGYGSQRIVPQLQWQGLRRAPKAIIGYSDTTALLSAALTAGVVAVHGPMVADDMAKGLTARSATHLHRLLSDPGYLWEIELPDVVRPGRARGRLVGGCLSVFVTLLGTPWAPDTDGAILFLEDVHERPFRLDRLLTQLKQAGKLDRLAGLVFGPMARCPEVDGVGPRDVVQACCGELGIPVAYGVPSGHDERFTDCENLALPLGVEVVLDTTRGRLAALEPAVV
jgi:muramoyltetrapeptide carboxypeptidase